MRSQTNSVPGMLLVALTLVACSGGADSPVDPLDGAFAAVQSRSADDCINVSAQGSGTLGPWAYGGYGGFGLQPTAITLGGISGVMASFVDFANTGYPGKDGRGAEYLTLNHVFWADGDLGSFLTQDLARCAPSDNNAATCRVNDRLHIVSGDGMFENASGMLKNHGWIEFTSFEPVPAGTLDLRVHGRVCGDGVVS